ncbi:MAG: oligosaccharide flippase family protein [Acidaminobacteraceae bacterium]
MENSKNNFRKFLRDMSIVFSTDIFLKLKAFIIIPIITRMMGVTNFGLWTQINAFVTLLITILMIGIPAALIRFLPGKDKEEFDNDLVMMFTILLSSLILGCLVIYIFKDIILKIVFDNNIGVISIYLAMLLIVSRSLKTFIQIYYRSILAVKYYSLSIIIESFVGLSLLATFINIELSINSIIYSFIATDILIVIIGVVKILKSVEIRRPNFERKSIYLRFSILTLPIAISNWINNSIDRFFIGYFLGTFQMGLYSAAYSISSMVISIIASPLWIVFPTMINNLWNAGEEDKAKRLIERAIIYQLVVLVPIGFAFAFFGKPLFVLYLSNSFEESFILVGFIVVSYIFYMTSAFFETSINLIRKPEFVLVNYMGCSVFNIILNLILIRWIGTIGAAITTLLTMMSLCVLNYIRANREMNIKIKNFDVIKIFSIAGIVFPVFTIFFVGNLRSMVLMSLISITVYILLILKFKVISYNEVRFLKKSIMNK